LTLVNLTTIAIAIGVLLAYPQYAGIAFYILLGWMVGSLVLLYGPWANRPVGRRSPTGTGPPPTAPQSGSRPLPSDLGFCIYCAAPLAPGTPTCSACGHSTPSF
jgi:hypothetical protein